VKARINPDYCWFDMRLIRSKIHRRGVRAAERIPARRFVIEYTGRLMSRKEYDLFKAHKSPYVWQINSYWSIDGGIGGSGAEFINHSCDPNLRVEFRGRRVFYISRREIKKGEELTIDYRFDPDPKPVVCKCGSKKCRGTINVKE
jgi:SET domain-containing protein